MQRRRTPGLVTAALTALFVVGVDPAWATSGHHEADAHAEPPPSVEPAHGEPGEAQAGEVAAVVRDVTVTMTDDLRFSPAEIEVVAGETIRFLLDNPTAATHDFTLGDLETQEQHRAEMASGMGHDDDQPMDEHMASGMHMDMETDEHDGGAHADGAVAGLPPPVVLEPGASAEVVATFGEAGEVLIGCHVPGHWEAGMRGLITVLPSTPA